MRGLNPDEIEELTFDVKIETRDRVEKLYKTPPQLVTSNGALGFNVRGMEAGKISREGEYLVSRVYSPENKSRMPVFSR